jgi:hypothetical protein
LGRLTSASVLMRNLDCMPRVAALPVGENEFHFQDVRMVS